jgi:hypothetical protein
VCVSVCVSSCVCALRACVRASQPGTNEFQQCENCLDGIDGTILAANTTTLAFFEADLVEADHIDDDDDTTVVYKTSFSRMPTQPQLGEASNMDAVFGFYTAVRECVLSSSC